MKGTIELNLSGAKGEEKDWKVTLVSLPTHMQQWRGHVNCWSNADDNFRIASVAYPDLEVDRRWRHPSSALRAAGAAMWPSDAAGVVEYRI